MVLTGLGGSILTGPWRHRMFRLAALCMLLTGVLAVVRGVSSLGVGTDGGDPVCVNCMT
jgi:hypothetical protein